MNYFQPYPLGTDEKIVAAWDSQIAEAKETPWLADALAQAGSDLFPRFAGCYTELRVLPRSARRALQRQLARSREVAIPSVWQRKLACSLAGAALLLALGRGVAQAAGIIVNTSKPGILADGKCSLIEAIVNANDDAATHPDCVAGSGADTILLPKKTTHTLTYAYTDYYGPTGLPLITTQISIEGNGSKIVRSKSAAPFRLMAVDFPGDLTLRNVTLSGGYSYDAPGGGVFIGYRGALTIANSTISGNRVVSSPGYNSFAFGGGIYNSHGTLTIENSTISGNTAVTGTAEYIASALGGGIYSYGYEGTVSINNSTISGNKAMSGTAAFISSAHGGGISNGGYGYLNIANSTVSGNAAVSGTSYDFSYASAGGIDSSDDTLTIANSTISGNTAVSGTGYYGSGASGGGIWIGAETATITNSTISGNRAVSGTGGHYGGYYNNGSRASGGGVVNSSYYSLSITKSTISGNIAKSGKAYSYDSQASGGGVSNYGYLAITKSTISANTAASGQSVSDDSRAFGGGVSNGYDYGTLTLTNSTISGNTAVSGKAYGDSVAVGGGISNYERFNLENSTVTGNVLKSGPAGGFSGSFGGGIFNYDRLYLSRSLISGNKAPVGPEIYNRSAYYGTVNAYNYNLFGGNGSAGVVGFSYGGSDIVPGVALSKIIGPLKNNGGPTKTHALPAGSPAIDAVPSATYECTGTDQRGILRPLGGGCDIGAFERKP